MYVSNVTLVHDLGMMEESDTKSWICRPSESGEVFLQHETLLPLIPCLLLNSGKTITESLMLEICSHLKVLLSQGHSVNGKIWGYGSAGNWGAFITLLHKVSQTWELPHVCQKSTVPNKECGVWTFYLVSVFLTWKMASAYPYFILVLRIWIFLIYLSLMIICDIVQDLINPHWSLCHQVFHSLFAVWLLIPSQSQHVQTLDLLKEWWWAMPAKFSELPLHQCSDHI
jgi:hypothetical protein